jgi:hypothetical protein
MPYHKCPLHYKNLKLLGENIAALVCRKRGTIDLCIMKQHWRYFISNLVQIFTQNDWENYV